MSAFDEVFSPYGGRLDETLLSPFFRQLIQARTRQIEKFLSGYRAVSKAEGCNRQLEFGWINDWQFNAFAGSTADSDTMGINVGLAVRFFIVFQATLRRPEVFEDVGSPESREPLPVFEQDMLADIPTTRALLDMSRPEALVATELETHALIFIVLHELAHIKNGHTEWSRSPKSNIIKEIHGEDFELKAVLDQQTLEFDADCQAVFELIVSALGGIPRPETSPFSYDIPEIGPCGGVSATFYRICFAIYTCCKFFDDGFVPESIEEVLRYSHPPAHIRTGILLGHAISIIHLYTNLSANDLLDVQNHAFISAEQSWNLVTGSPIVNIFDRRQVELGGELIRMMEKNWIEIRPALEKFKRFGDLAPVTDENSLYFVPPPNVVD